MNLYLIIGVLLFVVAVVIIWMLVSMERENREILRRRQQAEREKAETKRIIAAMRAIGAEQSAALSVQAMNACVALLAEAQTSTPELAAFRSDVVNITPTFGVSPNPAYASMSTPSHRSE